MATTIHPSVIPTQSRKPGNGRRPLSQSRPPPPDAAPVPAAKADPFYGYENLAQLCNRFISHLFACPELPPISTNSAHAKLPFFIAYALHRTKLHQSVTYASLVLLQRLKARFPTARGSSGHRLFISAYMIASKVICDDTYSNKSWCIVAQNMFTLREINQMEREMCNYLDWELTVDNDVLNRFRASVERDFASLKGPYPQYPLEMVSKRAIKAAASTSATPVPEPSTTTSPIPIFGTRNPSPARPSQPQSNPLKTAQRDGSSPIPATPSPSHSNSTSPASSGTPATPPSMDDFSAKIVDGSPTFSRTESFQTSHPLKGKMFAFAVPTAW